MDVGYILDFTASWQWNEGIDICKRTKGNIVGDYWSARLRRVVGREGRSGGRSEEDG